MTAHTEREGLRAHVRDLERQIARLRAENMAARDRALEEAWAAVMTALACETNAAQKRAGRAIQSLKGAKT